MCKMIFGSGKKVKLLREVSELEIGRILDLSDKISIFYVYSPHCGTCILGEQMVNIVRHMLPDLPFYKSNLNYWKELTVRWEVATIPCLVICRNGELTVMLRKIESVAYLYEQLSNL